MRRIILACLIAAFIADAAEAGAVFHKMTFQRASRKARTQNKLVMIDFYTTWCGPCKKLDKTTWKDREVKAWLSKHTVAIKIDCDKNKKLPEQFAVQGYPTMVFTTSDGAEVGRMVGYRDPASFLASAREIADRVSASGIEPRPRRRAAATPRHLRGAPRPRVKSIRDEIRLQLARARVNAEQNKHDEALAAYLQCFDKSVGLGGDYKCMRLYLLLDEILRLGKGYPPALDALKRRRKIDERAVLSGGANTETTEELVALNSGLGKPERTLRTYDRLKKKGDVGTPARRDLFLDVVDLLLEAKRYQDVLEGAAEASADIEAGIRFHRKLVRRMNVEGNLSPNIVAAVKEEVTGLAGKLYEAMLGTGQGNEASALADHVIGFDAAENVFAMLVRHAAQANASDTVLELKQRAKEALSEEEYSRLPLLESEMSPVEEIPASEDAVGASSTF